MSIYSTLLIFPWEDLYDPSKNRKAPWSYDDGCYTGPDCGKHSSLHLEIGSPFCDLPWLRLGLDDATVILDKEQVKEIRDVLDVWLAKLAATTREE